MKKIFTFLVLLIPITVLADWGLWDADRSYITFNVKGSTVTKTVWYSGAGNYQNFDFGTFLTGDIFQLTAYDIKTWKNSGGDVTGGTFYYVIYIKGNRPGSPAFSSIANGWLAELGGGNQKWGFTGGTTNMLSGLAAGEYTIEIYSTMNGNTPTKTEYDNNSGSNYIAHFRYNYIRSNADGNWSSTSTWLNNLVPDASTTTVEINNAVSLDNAFQCYGLTINTGKSLTLTTGKYLTVSGTLTNNAGTSGLVIKTQASLKHNTNSISATLERDITSDSKKHFISCPMTGTMPEICDDKFAPTTGNFNSTTGATYDFYMFDETAASSGNVWLNLKNASWGVNTSDFGNPPRFTAGKAYLVDYTADYLGGTTKAFAGTLANGSQNLAVTYSNNHFNLVGNPFCSSIDWKASSGWNRDVLATDAGGKNMWIYNGTAGNYGVYNSADPDDEGTNGITRYIAPAQGFFVESSSAGNVTLDNNVRVINSGTQVKSGDATTESVRIKVTGSSTPYSDEIKISFGHPDNNGGSAKWWSMYADAPSLYTVKNDLYYAINFLSAINENPAIPLSFKAGADGNYTFTSAFNQASFNTISLQDLKTGNSHDLKLNPVYTFSAATADDAARFILHFSGNLGVNDNERENPFKIYSYGNSICVVSNTGTFVKGDVYVYNLTGQQLMHQTLSEGGLTKISINTVTGYYLVKVVTEKEAFTGKIFIQ